MSNVVIVGAQWGDEGKGKIVDYLAERVDVVVRAQGGNNAGHTVIHDGVQYIFHLVPSGVLWPGKVCVIGNGMVVDPLGLFDEIDTLAGQGVSITPENLRISSRAHVVLPYHRALDVRRESGNKPIGTTRRGIGPAYKDKIDRNGFRMIDLFDQATFVKELAYRLEQHNQMQQEAGRETLDADQVRDAYLAAAKRLEPFVTDTVAYLHEAIGAQKNVLFEGAQGTFLDIDHGTYPYVTSSNTTAGGACTGSGVPPHCIDRVMAVAKAYTTRVGEGPFVAENDFLSDKLHEMGREFGATTGRPRRCGWFDAVMVRYANMINGTHELALTNLDGLDTLDKVRICVAYELDGQRLNLPPAAADAWGRCQAVYEELPGWQSDTSACRDLADLPDAAQQYLHRLSELTGAPIALVSVGPGRDQLMVGESAVA